MASTAAYERLPASPMENTPGDHAETPNLNVASGPNEFDCAPPLPRRRGRKLARALLFVAGFIVVLSFVFRNRVRRAIIIPVSALPPLKPDPVRDGQVLFQRDCVPIWNETIDLDSYDDQNLDVLDVVKEYQLQLLNQATHRLYPPPRRPEPPFLYRARYSLPVNLDSIYFLNRGSFASGTVRYELAPHDSDSISIDVSMRYWRKEVQGRVNMCVLHRGGFEKGFGIFTPPKDHWNIILGDRRDMRFEVVVGIPQSALAYPVANLASDLHDFSQTVDGIKHYWSSVNLTSTNGAIVVQPEAQLQAANLTLHTTNARIEGSFVSDHSLKIETTNDPILADIGLSNQGGYPTTTARVWTTNARINASFYLSGAYPDDEAYRGSQADFNIHARSSNGPIDIAIPVAPINHKLRMLSHTSNAYSKAQIHRTFEGLFRARTTHAPAEVSTSLTSADDPLGQDREPTLQVPDQYEGYSHGKFFWGDRYRSRSSEFELLTSNAPVEITFI
ncbi:hypothetical protein DL93DRAFT_2163771 [Clavulina sp. PMI_390]|nr:hypothetical protein DL93DRAFT_2163771 [Clavulina sp. PMI_390]